MDAGMNISPFDNCPSLDGYHCQTNSLAKMFHYYDHPLSEDMLLGLGAGMGFIYWKLKMDSGNTFFIGGRANNKDFFSDVGKRTGVQIRSVSTGSVKKAEAALLEKLKKREPVMVFGDMGFLPWFQFPQDYHFGGHTFVVCGYDSGNMLLASDMDQAAPGLKKGFYAPISLEQLSKARSSTFKPFPPKNTYLEFDFRTFHQPEPEDIYAAIRQTVNSQLNPPIKNLGVKGMRFASDELLKWPDIFNEYELRMNLFTIYIFIEIGGTGGGCFRYMYSRFLKEAAEVIGNDRLSESAENFRRAGERLSEIGDLFKEPDKGSDLGRKIKEASSIFLTVAELEEKGYASLARCME